MIISPAGRTQKVGGKVFLFFSPHRSPGEPFRLAPCTLARSLLRVGVPRWSTAKWPRRVFEGQEKKNLPGPQSGECRPASPALPADRHQPSLAASAGPHSWPLPIPQPVQPRRRGAEQPPRQPRTGRGRIGAVPREGQGSGPRLGAQQAALPHRQSRPPAGARPAGGSGRPGRAKCPHGQGD